MDEGCARCAAARRAVPLSAAEEIAALVPFGHGPLPWELPWPRRGDIALRSLLDRFPNLTVAVHPGELGWQPGLTRSLHALPVQP